MIAFPWNMMFRNQVRPTELLNHIGQVLDVGLDSNESYLWIATQLRITKTASVQININSKGEIR